MDLNLKNKKVLVTGGTKGIGKGITKAFLKEGAQVGIVARSEADLLQVKNELNVKIYQKDLLKENERAQLITEFIQDFHTIDILINNVGTSYREGAFRTPIPIFDEVMDLNFIVAVHLSQLSSEYMIKNGSGAIINIASIYGKESGGSPSYNASKSALISFTKSFSAEAIKHNIRVNGIAPGAIFHPNEEWERRLKADPNYLKKYANDKIPAGRLGTPEEIGNVAVFLASDKASWIVGSTISVDGGQSRLNY